MTSGLQSDRIRQTILFGLFFLSGVAALIYQTAWHRRLGLFAGADTIAAALVVGAFLLGLGIGSLAAGLYADRLSRRAALIAFAICEVGIALFAVLSPWLYYDVIYRELLPLAESRGVIFAYEKRPHADGWQAAVRVAAEEAVQQLRAVMPGRNDQ